MLGGMELFCAFCVAGCCGLQLWTIHNITCGPYFTDAALELLKEASWGWNQGSRGTAEEELEIAAIQSEPVMMALESLR